MRAATYGARAASKRRRSRGGAPARKARRTCGARSIFCGARESAALRRRLDYREPLQFLLLEELRDAGMTDYAARIVPFGGADTASLKGDPPSSATRDSIRCKASSFPARRTFRAASTRDT
mgnify:CR=1 FL=1